MALGARAGDVRRLVMLGALRFIYVGIAVGILLAYFVARVLASQIWGVTWYDPLTLGGVLIVPDNRGSRGPPTFLRGARHASIPQSRSDTSSVESLNGVESFRLGGRRCNCVAPRGSHYTGARHQQVSQFDPRNAGVREEKILLNMSDCLLSGQQRSGRISRGLQYGEPRGRHTQADEVDATRAGTWSNSPRSTGSSKIFQDEDTAVRSFQ